MPRRSYEWYFWLPEKSALLLSCTGGTQRGRGIGSNSKTSLGTPKKLNNKLKNEKRFIFYFLEYFLVLNQLNKFT